MTNAITMLGLPFLMCLMIVAIVGYMGLHVLKREVIFIDIALAQFAAAGAIAPHIIWGVSEDSAMTYVCPLVCIAGVSAVFALVRRRVVEIPLEAAIGVSYAIAAGGALFLIGMTTGGHTHVKHMLTGGILWTTWSDIFQCLLVFSVVGFLFYLMREYLRRISEDYDAAAREGLRVALWDFLFYTLFGIVIIMAVRIAGVVVVFCFLIIPATTSAVFSSGWTVRLVFTWVFGALASAMGLLFAYCLDFSLGASVAAFSGLILIVSGLFFRRDHPKLIVGTGVFLLTAFALFVVVTAPSRPGNAAAVPFDNPGVEASNIALGSAETTKELSDDEMSALAAKAKDTAEIERLFSKAPGPQSRADIICRALELDGRTGAELLLRFLDSDPPLFFRSIVVGKLAEVTNERIEFDVTQDFSAPTNQKAAAKLIELFRLDTKAKSK